MGGFLTNLFVRSDDQKAVVRETTKALSAFINPQQESLAERLLKATMPGDAQALENLRLLLRPVFAGGSAAAYVSAPKGNWIGVYDSETAKSPDCCPKLALALSSGLHTEVIAFHIYDGDILQYWLSRDGSMVSRFNSDPRAVGGVGGRPG